MAHAGLYLLALALVVGAGLYQYQFGSQVDPVSQKSDKDPLSTFASGPGNGDPKSAFASGPGNGDPKSATPPSNTETDDVDVQQNKPADSTPSQYYNPPFDPDNPPAPLHSKSGIRLITLNELAAHGVNGSLRPLWLAVAGRVYDVDKGAEHYYGKDGGYNFFTGRDGSRAFVTGEFNEEGLTDDLTGLSPLELTEIENWVKMYNKDYTFVGKLIGRYFDEEGKPRKAWYKYKKGLEQADKIKEEQKAQEQRFPPCNSRFTPEEGGTVSCSTLRLV